jgi:hypothetical protein
MDVEILRAFWLRTLLFKLILSYLYVQEAELQSENMFLRAKVLIELPITATVTFRKLRELISGSSILILNERTGV